MDMDTLHNRVRIQEFEDLEYRVMLVRRHAGSTRKSTEDSVTSSISPTRICGRMSIVRERTYVAADLRRLGAITGMRNVRCYPNVFKTTICPNSRVADPIDGLAFGDL